MRKMPRITSSVGLGLGLGLGLGFGLGVLLHEEDAAHHELCHALWVLDGVDEAQLARLRVRVRVRVGVGVGVRVRV